MRVVMVTSWFPTEKNPSSGTFVVKDCQALAAGGADINVVHLVSPQLDDGSRHLRVHGLKTVRIPMATYKPFSIVRARLRLQRYIEAADIVHTQAISAIEPFAFRAPGKPWVHTEHWSGLSNPQSLPPSWQKIQPALKQLERFPDVVVAVNEYLAKPIRQVRGAKPVEVIPCQVPMPTYLVPRRTKRDSLRIISTGGLIPRKRPLVAVETVAELNARGRKAELLWLGDGPLRADVEQLASAQGVRLTLPGHVAASEVQERLGQSDIFIGPTEAENFFVSAAEAILNGRPVVVSDMGGHPEYVNPAIGEIVSGTDPKDWADAVQRVEAKTAAITSEEIVATIGNRFSPSSVADAYFDLYCNIRG